MMSDINQVTVEGVTYDIEDEVARQGVEELHTYVDNQIEASKADWDQNDETAADYVKNRLAYSAEGWHSSPEVSLNLNNQDGSQGGAAGYYNSTSLVIAQINESLITTRFFDNLQTGEDIKITFDNQEYDGYVSSNSSRQIVIRAYVDNSHLGILLLDFRTESVYGDPGYGDELNFLIYGNFNPDYISNGTHTISFQRNSRYTSRFLSESYLQGRIIRHGSAPGAEIFNSPINTASGLWSHAEGEHTIASGSYSHAEGNYTTASGKCSHAEGNYTTASEYWAHAEGSYTTASGQYSHAEGSGTTASEKFAHAEGSSTTASRQYSHVEGRETHSTGIYSHVQGKWNTYQDSQGNELSLADVVGNGTRQDRRSNAYTLDWDGNGWFAGKVTAGAAPVDDMDLTTKKFVEEKIAALEARISALENA